MLDRSDSMAGFIQVNPKLPQQLRSTALVLSNQADEQVVGPDARFVPLGGLLTGVVQHPLRMPVVRTHHFRPELALSSWLARIWVGVSRPHRVPRRRLTSG